MKVALKAMEDGMKRFLLAGVAALALTGCTAFDDGVAPLPGSALSRVADRLAAGGDNATAAALYRSAIALGNTGPEVRRGYANALLSMGDARAAIEQYELALTQAKDARIYNGLGVAYDMLGEHDRAQEQFRTGLALAPDNNRLIHNYGLSLAAATASDPAPTSAPALAFTPAPASEPAPAPASTPAAARVVVPPAPSPSAAAVMLPDAPPAITPTAAPTVSPPVKLAPVVLRAPEPAAMAVPDAAHETNPEPDVMAAPEPAAMAVPDAAPETNHEPVAMAASEPAPAAAEEPVMPRPNEIVPLGQPVAATPLHGEYFRVRLAGYATRERAMEFRREIELRTPELQHTVRVVAERASLALRAQLRYALVSAPLPSRLAAEIACGALAARGLACNTEPASSPLTVRL